MESWRLLDTGSAPGAYNMAVDDALVRGIAAGSEEPVLRLFGWRPPAISFGYGQDPAREVDLERCRQAGVGLVRRLTGGRAVLHWEELTYSIICPGSHPLLGGRLDQTYRLIGESLVAGLRRFGVAASLERVSGRTGASHQQSVTAPCFSSIARWEVTCRGRKLVGSAQRRRAGVILQHGSLLIGQAHRRLLELLADMPEDRRREWARQLQEHSIELQECVRERVDAGELGACLAAGFAEGLQAQMRPDRLSAAEDLLAQHLATTRYADPFQRPLRECTVTGSAVVTGTGVATA